jgi:hypothetical protein
VGEQHCEVFRLGRRTETEAAWIRTVPIVTLLGNCKTQIQEVMKRTVQVNVKMSPEDFSLLKKAAEKKWPDAVMTNSGIVLGLAKISAREALRKGNR